MSALDTIRAALFGSPPVDGFKPSRSGVLSAFGEIYNKIADSIAGVTAYKGYGNLPGVSAADNGKQARVYGDPNDIRNGYYVVSNGAWVKDNGLFALATDNSPGLLSALDKQAIDAIPGELSAINNNVTALSADITNRASAAGAAAASSYAIAATLAAGRAAAYVAALVVGTFGIVYQNDADGLAAVSEGKGYVKVDVNGRLHVEQKVNGAAIPITEIATDALLRPQGISVASMPNFVGDGVNNDAPAIKAALAIGKTMGVAVLFPGPGYTLLCGDDFVNYGTFTGPNGDRPFSRGMFEMYTNMRLLGGGCTLLLSGGRSNPAGLFYQNFWDYPGERLKNVRIQGLRFDGNLAAQTIESYPAGTTDNVWQHANAVGFVLVDNVIVDDFESTGFRGNDIAFLGMGGYPPCTNITVTRGLMPGSFGIGLALGSSRNVKLRDITFKALPGSWWIGCISTEVLGPADFLLDHDYENINFYLDAATDGNGLGPVEATLPQYATNSTDAANARLQIRRAIVFIKSRDDYPGGVYNGHIGRLRMRNIRVFQGVIQAYNADQIEADNVAIYNTYENFGTGIERRLLGTDALLIKTDDSGIGFARITNCHIDNDLEGRGIYLKNMMRYHVSDNTVLRSRLGGMRVENSDGIIGSNHWENCGRPYTSDELAANPDYGYALQLFGGQIDPTSIARQIVIESRPAPAAGYSDTRGARGAIWASEDAIPFTVVDRPLCRGTIDADIMDVSGNLKISGFDDAGNWTTNRPIALITSFSAPHITVENVDGDASLDINAPTGSRRSVSFNTRDGNGNLLLGPQAVALGNNALQINMFDANVAKGTPITFNPDGSFTGIAYWETPYEIIPGTFIWVTRTDGSGGQLRKKIGRPTTDLDGAQFA